jgi:hypothetical protein
MTTEHIEIDCPFCGEKNSVRARFCYRCGHEFSSKNTHDPVNPDADKPKKSVCQMCAISVSSGATFCPRCGAVMRNAEWEIQVSGINANEVQSVSEALLNNMSKKEKSPFVRNPWISGSFYLATAVVLIVLLLVVARSVDLLILPVVIVGAMLTIAIIGAFQLRQDKSLSEKNFLSLMFLTFTQLPFLRKKEDNEKK